MTFRILVIVLALYLPGVMAAAAQSTDTSRRSPDAERPDVWNAISDYRGWPVSRLIVTGVDRGTAREIRRGLDLATDGILYQSRLREDINRITLFLARRGYLYARVTPAVVPDEEKREIQLTLDIDGGHPVVVRSYELENIPDRHHASIMGTLRLRSGDVFADRSLEADIESVIGELKEQGYAHAEAVAAFTWFDSTAVGIRIVA